MSRQNCNFLIAPDLNKCIVEPVPGGLPCMINERGRTSSVCFSPFQYVREGAVLAHFHVSLILLGLLNAPLVRSPGLLDSVTFGVRRNVSAPP